MNIIVAHTNDIKPHYEIYPNGIIIKTKEPIKDVINISLKSNNLKTKLVTKLQETSLHSLIDDLVELSSTIALSTEKIYDIKLWNKKLENIVEAIKAKYDV